MLKKRTTSVPDIVSSLPQPMEPNQRVHEDLFGPLKTAENGKQFILCITYALTKYVLLVALPNKEVATLSSAIFNHWICRFSILVDLITDQGKEFCARVLEDLLKQLGTAHL
jgi:hypothetical protein